MPKLMIPGPIEVEPEVLAVMAQPIVAHYGAAWVLIHDETIRLLQRLYQTAGDVYMLPGSGSLAIDTAAHSAFHPGETVIVADNGWFGHRVHEIVTATGARVVRVQSDMRRPLNPDDIAAALDKYPDAAGVAVVHLETSTGILNPIHAIAEIVRAKNNDILLLVDAVTSLGGADLQMDAWGIDLCASASQKALGAPPGLGLVAVSPRAQARMEARPPEARHSWYVDLARWHHYATGEQAAWHPTPVTMPTPTVLALHTALCRLFAEGIDERMARYERQARHLRDGLADMGYELFVPEGWMSAILTSVFAPPGVNALELRDTLLRDADILITTAFDTFRTRVFRVGHMGGAIQMGDIDALLSALRAFVPVGS
ncbi:MAG: alanine--glyoxylate aminotransferase family protein [Chloroflexota bacterium]|nr:alanine--glyoxylate aminotransferase family protein [Chloroflexota bacterium]